MKKCQLQKYNQLSDKLIRKSQQNAAKNTSGLFGAVKTKKSEETELKTDASSGA
ncbi:hypothetical protein NXW27_05245 [Phocaeicola dorei]|nr:hypothetical protein [Phocaeicola dorei]MCS2917025.1 hypothetical protein [Parabacteroides merdae]MCS2919152.1 hypothetical protein [Parabacteroides merdae]UVR75265.1 hypothetical protein NXX35_06490 [Bacteroides xylanisolvens]